MPRQTGLRGNTAAGRTTSIGLDGGERGQARVQGGGQRPQRRAAEPIGANAAEAVAPRTDHVRGALEPSRRAFINKRTGGEI